MTTTYKYNKDLEFLKHDEKLNQTKSCNFCSHQKVCSGFANFKLHVEPMLLNQDSTLKAENLAKICDMYLFNEDDKRGV